MGDHSERIDDILTIRRVTNGFIVHVGGGERYQQVDTLVFNFVDDLCEGIKLYYEGTEDESSRVDSNIKRDKKTKPTF